MASETNKTEPASGGQRGAHRTGCERLLPPQGEQGEGKCRLVFSTRWRSVRRLDGCLESGDKGEEGSHGFGPGRRER